MANVAYPPFFPAQILDGDGQPVANGAIRAAFAGSDVPAPLFTPDGTALGSSVTLNSSGEAVFCLRAGTAYKLTCLDAQGATVWTRDNVRVTTADSGMANPMEAEGDMIVGAVDGQPERLAPGTEGQALKIVSGVPAWATDEEGMQNPMTTEGDLIVGGTGGEPSRLGVGAAGEVLTSDGTTWAPAAIPTQTGDHKAQVSATDSTPNYLQNKIVTGDLVQVEKQQIPDGEGGYIESLRLNLDARGVTAGYVPTADGSNGASWAAPATQPGDHQLLVSATDAAAGYLGAKLTPGNNITITPQTDGDGVQTLEISATGGGGGGGSAGAAVWAVHPNIATTQQIAAGDSWKTSLHKIFVPKLTPSHVAFALSFDVTHFTLAARVGIYTANRVLCYYGEASFASAPDYLGLNSSTGEFYSISVSAVPTAPKTEFENEFVILAVSFPSYGSYRPSFLSYNAANSSVRKMTAPITSSLTTLPNPDGEILTRTCAVGIL